MERGKTIRICKRCMKSWNVSKIDHPGKSDYICPVCEAKMKKEKSA